ncbi:tyrosine-type recombinase/integrase [Haloglycomyces albus]|uniref:tyrosine-type recombinase/integrase n=1 Tax=Haloglycomyces albus TaxID=526067 RepID=UPI00146FB129|nr:tyrosine-type recombinase/integrase [Haloglycomyces albus]
MSAYLNGEPFRLDTRRPESWAPKNTEENQDVPSIAEFAIEVARARWNKGLAPNTHKRSATGLAPVILGFCPSNGPFSTKACAVVVRGRMLARRPTSAAMQIPTAVDDWVRENSAPVTQLEDPKAVRACLDAIVLKQVGGLAARHTFARRREELSRLIKTAIRDGWISNNLLDDPRLGWERPKMPTGGLADPREAFSPDQFSKIRAAIEARSSTWKYRAIFHLMYRCFLRTGEAIALKNGDITFLDNGRGILHVRRQSVTAGSSWTEDGSEDELRHLKAREEGEERSVPIPESVVNDISEHQEAFGRSPGAYLVSGAKREPLDRAAFNKVWKQARNEALGDEINVNPHLAGRLYSMRVSGISRLIAKGIPVPTIARWAGNTPAILHSHYSKFIEGDEQRWIDLMNEDS